MGLESATYIDSLNPAWPLGGDQTSQGDDHIRQFKQVVQNTFPNINGPVTADPAELNKLDGCVATTAELNHLSGVTSALQTQLDAITATLTGLFPIGYILQTTVATNPGTHLPGTWTQIAKGRTLIGEGTGVGLTARVAGAQGGQEDAVVVQHNHGITDPGHTHDLTAPSIVGGGSTAWWYGTDNGVDHTEVTDPNTMGITVNNEGVSGTDKNMQPYLVVYIWERTA